MMVLVDQQNNVIPQPLLVPNFAPQPPPFMHQMHGVSQSGEFDPAWPTRALPQAAHEGMFPGQMAPPQLFEQHSKQQRTPSTFMNPATGQFQPHMANPQVMPQQQVHQSQSQFRKPLPTQSGVAPATQQQSAAKQPHSSQVADDATSRPTVTPRPSGTIGKYTPGSDRVIDVALDQQGSRLIQTRLSTGPPAVVSAIVDEVIADLKVLTKDVFGNYVVQKAFEHADFAQQQRVSEMLRGNIVELSMHVYGCRVVQKVLEVFDVTFHSLVISELVERLTECVCDPNGNHVVQKAVERASPELLQPVVDILREDVFTLATHLYGCRVMQRILEYCISEQSNPILQVIVKSGPELLRDQFGNYVVQHIIGSGPPLARASLLELMCGALPELAVHKFASNVVEKVSDFRFMRLLCPLRQFSGSTFVLFLRSGSSHRGISHAQTSGRAGASSNCYAGPIRELCNSGQCNQV